MPQLPRCPYHYFQSLEKPVQPAVADGELARLNTEFPPNLFAAQVRLMVPSSRAPNLGTGPGTEYTLCP